MPRGICAVYTLAGLHHGPKGRQACSCHTHLHWKPHFYFKILEVSLISCFGLPQPHFPTPQPFTLQWSCLLVQTGYKARFSVGTCSGCLRAKNNVLVLHADWTLVIPKRAARQQPHHADCFTLVPPPLVSEHRIYSAWGSLLTMYLSAYWSSRTGTAKWTGSPPPFWEAQAKEGNVPGTENSAVGCGGTHPSHVLLSKLLVHSVWLLAARDVTMNKYSCQIKSLPAWDLLKLWHTFWAPKSD